MLTKVIQKIEQSNKGVFNIHFIANLIRQAGLSPYDPKRDLYGNERIHMNKHAGICQHPIELAKTIDLIIRMGYKNMIEIGAGHGWTSTITQHIVSKFQTFETTSVDKNPKSFNGISDISEVQFINENSWDLQGTFDVAFIDADHAYEAVCRDYDNFGRGAKMCVLHDIDDFFCPGVQQLWREIKTSSFHKEFIENPGKLGIGIVLRSLLK